MAKGIRKVQVAEINPSEICSRCQQDNARWDQIAGKTYCPNCLEALVLGIADPLIERTEKGSCVVCSNRSTLRYITFPLNNDEALELDLCGNHLRALLARCLDPHSFKQIQNRLVGLDVNVNEIFLLHSSFYDIAGQALMPAMELT